MRKLIATMNMSLDGFCDHENGIADDEIHEHYTDLLRSADVAIYGRKTFELMKYWKTVVENPTGTKADDDFAAAMDAIHKIVYSRTLDKTDWKSAELRRELAKDEILGLKKQSGKNILVGSPSLILQLGKLGVVDEYQISIQPTVIGSGSVRLCFFIPRSLCDLTWARIARRASTKYRPG